MERTESDTLRFDRDMARIAADALGRKLRKLRLAILEHKFGDKESTKYLLIAIGQADEALAAHTTHEGD